MLWVVGLLLVARAHTALPWHESGEAPDNQDEPQGHSQKKTEAEATKRKVSLLGLFAIAAAPHS